MYCDKKEEEFMKDILLKISKNLAESINKFINEKKLKSVLEE